VFDNMTRLEMAAEATIDIAINAEPGDRHNRPTTGGPLHGRSKSRALRGKIALAE